MVKTLATVLVLTVVALGLAFVSGCESDAQTGALIGAGAGAGIGQAVGRNSKSTLIGTAVGSTAGYMLGNESDKQKMKQQIAAGQAEQITVTVWITNSNGSRTPVKLRKVGPGYIGPKGEHYDNMPTVEQLKSLYGF